MNHSRSKRESTIDIDSFGNRVTPAPDITSFNNLDRLFFQWFKTRRVKPARLMGSK